MPDTKPENSKPVNNGKSLARLIAVQVIFEAEASRRNIRDILDDVVARPVHTILDSEEEIDETYDKNAMREIVQYAIENQSKIDKAINQLLSDKWKFSKIDPTLRATFRAASAEFLRDKTPLKVVITEYMGVVRAYQDDRDTMSFSNALLDALSKEFAT